MICEVLIIYTVYIIHVPCYAMFKAVLRHILFVVRRKRTYSVCCGNGGVLCCDDILLPPFFSAVSNEASSVACSLQCT